MSTTSPNRTNPDPGAGQPHAGQEQRRGGVAGLVTLAIALLVGGLPVALVLTTFVTLSVLSWSPTYEPSLSVALSIAILATTGLVLWL